MNNFESYIQGAIPVLVEFYTDENDACKRMAPVIQEVKEIAGDRAVTLRIDVDKHHEIAKQYNIYTVPGIALFRNGYLIWHKNGMATSHEILDRLMLEME